MTLPVARTATNTDGHSNEYHGRRSAGGPLRGLRTRSASAVSAWLARQLALLVPDDRAGCGAFPDILLRLLGLRRYESPLYAGEHSELLRSGHPLPGRAGDRPGPAGRTLDGRYGRAEDRDQQPQAHQPG